MVCLRSQHTRRLARRGVGRMCAAGAPAALEDGERVLAAFGALADANAKDAKQRTPLMCAIANGHVELAHMLAERGAGAGGNALRDIDGPVWCYCSSASFVSTLPQARRISRRMLRRLLWHAFFA